MSIYVLRRYHHYQAKIYIERKVIAINQFGYSFKNLNDKVPVVMTRAISFPLFKNPAFTYDVLVGVGNY